MKINDLSIKLNKLFSCLVDNNNVKIITNIYGRF